MLNKVAIGLTVSFSFVASGEDFPIACKISNPNKMDSYGDPETQIRVSGEWCDDTLFVSRKTYEEALQVCLESRAHMALKNYNVYIAAGSAELDNWDAKPVASGAFGLSRYNIRPQDHSSEN